MRQTINHGLTLSLPVQSPQKKTSALALQAGALLSCAVFLGLSGSLYSLLPFPGFASLPAIEGIVFILLWHLFLLKKPTLRAKILALLSVCAVILLFFILNFAAIGDGFRLIANEFSRALGQKTGRIYPLYQIGAAQSGCDLAATLFLLPLSAVFCALSVYLTRVGNAALSILLMLLLIALQLVLGVSPLWPYLLLFFLSQALLFVLRSMGKSHVGLKSVGKSILSVLLCAVLLLSLLLPALQLLFPAASYEKSALASSVQTAFRRMSDAMRYEASPAADNLPEGNFENLSSLSLTDTPALEVVMDKPTSLYLRGYVGGSYTSAGWQPVDSASLYENADLFYWLHQSGFFGQTQLSTAAKLADPSLSEEETLQITVHNIGANSAAVYAPYELLSASSSLLDANAIGDSALSSPGFWGTRTYNYTALSNQVKRYTTLSDMLSRAEAEPTQALNQYLVNESHYNLFVYETYTALSDDEKNLLANHLGAFELPAQATHLDYAQAKQKILEYLTQNYTYSEEITPMETGKDFLRYFLEETAEGYSVHFATAAALMFRYYGIPARYVEGYLITPEDVEGVLANSAIILDGTHAHAWVEIYQDGLGWVPFEVTPPYLKVMESADEIQGADPQKDPETQKDEDAAQEEITDENYEQAPNQSAFGDTLVNIAKILLYVVLASSIIFLVLAALYILRGRTALKKRRRAMREGAPKETVLSLFTYALQLLSALGLPQEKGPLAACEQPIAKALGSSLAKAYLEALSSYELAAYSPHSPTKQQKEQLIEFTEALTRQLRETSGFFRRLRLRFLRFLY